MIKIYLILFFFTLISIASFGQVKKASGHKEVALISRKLLIGKWRTEDDPELVLLFTKDNYIELYVKYTPDSLYYKLSTSCTLKV